jgi:hypothetical protein
MSDFNIVLPSKPKIVHEEGSQGVYEIDGLYPGYGHTLGNSSDESFFLHCLALLLRQ